jgi:MFS family permease
MMPLVPDEPTPDARLAPVQRRTVAVVVTAQVFGGLGLAAGVSVGVLIARQMLDSALLAGVPLAAGTAGGAAAAIGLSRLMGREGRRPGLVTGYALGATGSATVVLAAQTQSFLLLCLGMAVFGSGNVASLLARYAGADLAPAHSRGRALSLVLFATTFGAVAGPTLVGPTRAAAEAWGLPALTGPFLLAAVAYLVAAAVLAVLLRPDPLLLARAQAAGAAEPAGATEPAEAAAPPARAGSGSWAAVVRGRAALGLLAIVAAQFVMVLMMTMTPVHMADHGHGLTVIGFVISAHIAGMYALSPVAGWLTDRMGRVATIVAGAGVLAAAGVLGGIADPDARVALTLSLFLLGLGWSLVLVAGSTLLTDSVPLDLRAQAQGNADLLVGVSATVAAAGSGVVLDLAGWVAVASVTVAAAVLTATVAVARHGTAVPVRP